MDKELTEYPMKTLDSITGVISTLNEVKGLLSDSAFEFAKVVRERDRLRTGLETVRALLVMPPNCNSGSDCFTDPYNLQRLIDQILREGRL